MNKINGILCRKFYEISEGLQEKMLQVATPAATKIVNSVPKAITVFRTVPLRPFA